MIAGVLLSVFALALMGGAHCAAMCGGIAVAAESAHGAAVPAMILRRRGDWFVELLTMHAGRLTTYMLLGAVLGAIGATAWKAGYLPLQRWMFGAGSVLLIVSGIRLLRGRGAGQRRLERWVAKGVVGAPGLSRVAARLGRSGDRLATMARGEGWHRRRLRRYGMGLAWGLVPCGMVYGALALAMLAGNAASGALVMGAFGLGTLPNLLVLSGLSGYLRQLSRRPRVRILAGVLVVAFGVAGVVRTMALPHMLATQGFCLLF